MRPLKVKLNQIPVQKTYLFLKDSMIFCQVSPSFFCFAFW